jgi:hypothetical protein
MATVYVPFIRQEDFEAFRRLLGAHLSGAYDVWEQTRQRRIHQFIIARRRVISPEMDPDEFADWLRTTRREATLDALDAYAFVFGTHTDE